MNPAAATSEKAPASNDAELWELINNDYKELNQLGNTQYPALRAQLAAEALESFNAIDAFQTGAKTISKEEKTKLVTAKTEQLAKAIYTLKDLSFHIAAVLGRVRDNLMTYVVAELGPAEVNSLLKGKLEIAPLAAYHLLVSDKKAPDAKVFPAFVALRNRIDNAASFVALVKFLHSTETIQLPGLLFEKTKGVPAKDISSPSLPNWPGIKNCLETVRNIMERLQTEIRLPAEKRIFSDKELRHYVKKVAFTLPVVFNSQGARQSKDPQETPDIGVDLTPFQPIPESLYTAFLSPTQYVMNAFRSVIQNFTPYEIVQVDGDGNCFFRAVTRATFPRISKTWENKLSLALRKSVNTGVEKKLKNEGRADNYQFQGFVIENVNDSVTMAKAGVWADHVQVQKLSSLFGCPIRLITFDDVGIKITHEGRLCPGNDYVINPHFKRDALTLFFTPTPGHYEAVILKKHANSTSGRRGELDAEPTMQDLFLSIYQAMDASEPVSAPIVCALYLKLEEEAVRIGEILSQYNKAGSGDDVKQVIEAELNECRAKLTSNIVQFTAIVSRLGKGYIASLREHPDSILYQEMILPLVDDTLVFSGEECLQTGKGPLSVLYDTVQRCDPKKNEGISALFAPLTSLWSSMRMSPPADSYLSTSPTTSSGGPAPIAESTLEQLLKDYTSKPADFQRVLADEYGFKDRLQVKGVRLSSDALSAFFIAVRNLTQRGCRWPAILFTRCRLDFDCCQLLKGRLVSEAGVPSVEFNNCELEISSELVHQIPANCRLANCVFLAM